MKAEWLERIVRLAVMCCLAAVLFIAMSCSQPPQVVPSPVATAPPTVPSGGATASVPTTAAAEEGVSLAHLSLHLVPVWRGLKQPVLVTNAGDGSGRIFVAQQNGIVLESVSGSPRRQPYLDLSSLVTDSGEQGLLGMAFSPGFASNGRVYLDYIDRSGNTVVARYVADNPGSLTPSWRSQVILSVAQPYPNHNGGGIAFGPDGMLYVGTGDGGSEGDPDHIGQNLSTLLAKILRIDTGDATASAAPPPSTYRVPAGNPFVGRRGARPETWSYGLRNPWRFSFDASGGALWIGDVGQNLWEEVDYAPVGVGGQNWGWSLWEGDHRYPPGASAIGRSTLSFPILEYAHPFGETVVGGYVYRGAKQPALIGTYLYADYIKGWIGAIRLNSSAGERLSRPESAVVLRTSGHPSSFGVDEDGELYICDYGGTVYHVTAASR